MTTIVEVSDNEDSDDCVITSVVIVVDDEFEHSKSDLYNEVQKENQLLAEFVKNCLKLENSSGMLTILKNILLKYYYQVDKLARESPSFQKNLQRANHLIVTKPNQKFLHIKWLCNILKTLKVKKRVPFVTLSTNVKDRNCKSYDLKRKKNELFDAANCTSKIANLQSNTISSFSMTITDNLDDTCNILDESTTMETCCQSSSIAEEILIPKKDVIFGPDTFTESRIKALERKIACYKQEIAILDEQEVDDDSVNSPYIKSERLKTKIVSLYKERCQLLGNQPVKRKGIRLKLGNRHPIGPTKVLERFLNTNLYKDGNPAFPDFCDVVTCVTEANDKDGLGWSKAQIMNEASALFTLCGRALQKRRQKREYLDLINKVDLEDLEKDPADDDPQLRAKLEENKRIAVKKESDILERYTMMQYLPPKSKTQNNFSNINNSTDDIVEASRNSGAQKKLFDNNNTNNITNHVIKANMDESEQNHADAKLKVSDINTKSDSQLKQHFIQSHENESTNKDIITNNSTNNIIEPVSKAKENKNVQNGIENNDLDKGKLIVIENEILGEESIESQPTNPVKDYVETFKRLGNNFSVTVEIMNE